MRYLGTRWTKAETIRAIVDQRISDHVLADHAEEWECLSVYRHNAGGAFVFARRLWILFYMPEGQRKAELRKLCRDFDLRIPTELEPSHDQLAMFQEQP